METLECGKTYYENIFMLLANFITVVETLLHLHSIIPFAFWNHLQVIIFYQNFGHITFILQNNYNGNATIDKME